MDDAEDRTRWTGEQWTQHAARLASAGVEDAVNVLLDAVRNNGKQRNVGARMAAADRILQLVGALKPSPVASAGKPAAVVDLVSLSEQIRLSKQAQRRGHE